jgi:hypothetical protein
MGANDGGDLLTCPFCGGADLNVYRGHRGSCVQCFGCGASGVTVATWNKRANDILAARREARDAALEEAAAVALSAFLPSFSGSLIMDPVQGEDTANAILRLRSKPQGGA